MTQAIDNFINDRSKFSRYRVERVSVENRGGGSLNNCEQNAFDNIDFSLGMKLISGWVIKKENPTVNECIIQSHFWNSDKNDNHFDTTPLQQDYFEYIVDIELAVFAERNQENLRSLLCFSLIQNKNEYSVFDKLLGKDLQNKISDLSNLNIFKFKRHFNHSSIQLSFNSEDAIFQYFNNKNIKDL
jgi:hypothetical protein